MPFSQAILKGLTVAIYFAVLILATVGGFYLGSFISNAVGALVSAFAFIFVFATGTYAS